MALDLDFWTADIVSRELGGRPDLNCSSLREAIDIYTEEKRKAILSNVGADAWEGIPFTTKEQLREKSAGSLSVTEDDLQRAVDFYANGLRLIADETDTILILLPDEEKESEGRLMSEGLRSIGARVIDHGEPFTDNETRSSEEAAGLLQLIREEGVTCVAATPTHMIAIARAAAKQTEAGEEELFLRSVLLCGGFTPDKTAMMLEEVFQAMIFEHCSGYGFCGGYALSCGYGKGCHVRETDVYIELINPITGEVVRGESPKTPGYSNYGEIVFTALNREGSPLVRYRTGDYSRWILDPCPCGSQLKRLDKVYPGEEE